jgi:YHS domain-containing protein
MKTAHWLSLIVFSAPLALASCTDGASQKEGGTSKNRADAQFEYFCGMHPHVARERPGACPICNMPFSKRKAAITKLSSDDRRLVEAQARCPIGDSLGTQGTPFKIMIQGQAVFLCCEDCKEKALADPDQTLATVEQLKAKSKPGAPSK